MTGNSPTDPNEHKMLGLSTSEIANVSVEELTGNVTALKMVLHYYRQLSDENRTLKNSNNTLKTYVDAYDKGKSNSAAGAALLTLSSIVVAFGVNLLTGGGSGVAPGWVTFVAGVAIAVGGLYFSFWKDRAK